MNFPLDRPILLLGATGQIGGELVTQLAPLGEVVAPGHSAGELYLDLVDADSIRSVMRSVQPSLVINAAAYTNVDKAEQEPDIARAVNATAPGILAEETKRQGAALVHYSTDYVFDGTAASPYGEDAPTCPLGTYGRTKLEGEQAIQAIGGRFLILRTSWVYGLSGRNFLRTMLRLFQERDEIQVVDDQVGTPNWSRPLARATVQLLHAVDLGRWGRVVNLSCRGQTSWYGFAQTIQQKGGAVCRLTPIPTDSYPTPAKRPGYSVLSGDRARQEYGLEMPDWHDALAECMQEIT